MNVGANAVVLAHQGGWDEILMVLAPLAIFGGLLLLANRRAERLGEDSAAPEVPESAPEALADDSVTDD